MTEKNIDLVASLNAETGIISWQELQRHFARGVVVRVAKNIDLLKVAAKMGEDDKAALQGWMGAGLVARATDKDAQRWSRDEPELWTVVVAPWVLVQESKED